MDDEQNEPFQFSFNASLKENFQGSWGFPDGDLIARPLSDQRRNFVRSDWMRPSISI